MIDIIFSNTDTFHYKGADYGFDQLSIQSFSELDNIIAIKQNEGFTKCFIHEIYNQKNGVDMIHPTISNPNRRTILVRIAFIK